MVATVYTPNGIVVATASYDSFHEHLDTEDGIQISPINIEGLTHTYLFYNKYSLTFNGLNSYTIEFEILDKFDISFSFFAIILFYSFSTFDVILLRN